MKNINSDILLYMKNTLLFILMFILFLLVAFLYLDKYFISRKQITSLPKKVGVNTLKKVIPSPHVQITPGYSVLIVKAPYLDDFYGNFNFEVNIKNISVSPFITKIALMVNANSLTARVINIQETSVITTAV